MLSFFFFFNDTATTEIYTLSLHDALPIFRQRDRRPRDAHSAADSDGHPVPDGFRIRSEEHTSELQSRQYLVCRLLLEKKKARAAAQSAVPTTGHRAVPAELSWRHPKDTRC